jgi:hypothetical protein
MKIFTFLFFLFGSATLFAQTQTVRGKVFDSETNYPLIGVKLSIQVNQTDLLRVLSNADGEFEIKNVPIGKYSLEATYALYNPKSSTIEVGSGREVIVNVPMTEMIVLQKEVTVTGKKKGEVLNNMALLSAQQFSVSETNRYPGSRMDPARMASNFAGVGGSDDSRNDIVIRGNSPLGVLWRVEGVDIPNPNHFSISGSSGGPVSIINNKILGNSDFFMSAYPAEYGNSTAGVFDLKLRSGNNKKHEFTGQFGFLGTEFLAEGPMGNKGKASYLVMGRYSTLSLFEKLGIKIGTDAVPVYGDAAFKFNWVLKNNAQLSFFGIGGKSEIAIKISDQKKVTTDLYGDGDRDQYFGTSMYFSGLNYKKTLSEKTFFTATLAAAMEDQHTKHDYLKGRKIVGETIEIDTIYNMLAYTFKIAKISGYTALTHKINTRHTLKGGINLDFMQLDQIDSVLVNLDSPDIYQVRWDYNGSAMLVQPFIQWKWRVNENMDVSAGLHAQYFSLSNSLSPAEPRIAMKYRMKGNQSISAGAGMHSQIQPIYTYTYDRDASNNYYNKNMDFTRSLHTVFGYDKFFNKGFSIKTEAYYQHLYNVPVEVTPSSFSMINMGSGFSRIFANELQNTGTGFNYGLELTIQKYFDKSFFFLFSGTMYESKYRGSDNILRNTSFNGNYVANILVGKEFKISKNQVFGLGGKCTVAGGKRYGLVDVIKTNADKELFFKDSLFNDLQFADYFRVDFKISWRMDTKKISHEIGLDLVNILNTKNLLSLAYAPLAVTAQHPEPTAERFQLGRLPIFYYKIDFKAKSKK